MLSSGRRSPWFVAVAAVAISVVADCNHAAPVDQNSASRPSGTREHDMVTELLDQVATMSVDDYDPARVVRAVNALQPLGKEYALDQIAFWLRGHGSAQAPGLFWVLRVLFDLPAGKPFPPVRIGQPNIPPPTDPAAVPRFPIMVVHDTPFLVVSGYDLGGLPEPVDAHVAYFRAHGVVRDWLITLPGSLAGLEQEIARQWSAACGEAHLDEVLRAVRPQIRRLGG